MLVIAFQTTMVGNDTALPLLQEFYDIHHLELETISCILLDIGIMGNPHQLVKMHPHGLWLTSIIFNIGLCKFLS